MATIWEKIWSWDAEVVQSQGEVTEWACSGYSWCLPNKTPPLHHRSVLQICTKSPYCALSTLQCASTKGWGWWRLGQWWTMRDKGPWPMRLYLSRTGNKHRHLQAVYQRAQNSVYSQQKQRVNTGPTCFRTPPSIYQSPSSGKGENIYFKEREPQAQAQSFCSSNLPRPYPQ